MDDIRMLRARASRCRLHAQLTDDRRTARVLLDYALECETEAARLARLVQLAARRCRTAQAPVWLRS